MNKVKLLLLLSIGVLLSSTTMTANVSDAFSYDYAAEKAFYASYAESEIKSNVMNSNHVLANHYDASVQYFVKDNLYYGRKSLK